MHGPLRETAVVKAVPLIAIALEALCEFPPGVAEVMTYVWPSRRKRAGRDGSVEYCGTD